MSGTKLKATAGYEAIVHPTLANGADAKGCYGRSASVWAAIGGYEAIVKPLRSARHPS